jgi:hypothetical protein
VAARANVHEGAYVAVIEVGWIDSETAWSHWPSMDDARKLDEVGPEGRCKEPAIAAGLPTPMLPTPARQAGVRRSPSRYQDSAERGIHLRCVFRRSRTLGSGPELCRRHVKRERDSVPRQRKDFRIPHAPQSGNVGCQEVDGQFTAEDSAHNGFVEIRVGEKPNFHDGRAACISSRARINLSRRPAGSGSALRLPSAHFNFWRFG